MTPDVELSDVELEVLRSIAIASDRLPADRVTDTKEVSQLAAERLKAAGKSYWVVQSGPWFGLREVCTRLEDLGLIDVDPGMAEYVPRDAEAPTTEHYYLILEPAGREHLESLPD